MYSLAHLRLRFRTLEATRLRYVFTQGRDGGKSGTAGTAAFALLRRAMARAAKGESESGKGEKGRLPFAFLLNITSFLFNTFLNFVLSLSYSCFSLSFSLQGLYSLGTTAIRVSEIVIDLLKMRKNERGKIPAFPPCYPLFFHQRLSLEVGNYHSPTHIHTFISKP